MVSSAKFIHVNLQYSVDDETVKCLENNQGVPV